MASSLLDRRLYKYFYNLKGHKKKPVSAFNDQKLVLEDHCSARGK
jgi:hypothetical protein